MVYTPYKNKWKEIFDPVQLKIHSTNLYLDNLVKNTDLPNIALQEMGFVTSSIKVPDYDISPNLIQNYEATRNFPSKKKMELQK